MLNGISISLFKARKSFLWFVPGPAELLVFKWKRIYYACNGILSVGSAVKNVKDTSWAGLLGNMIGYEITKRVKAPIKHVIKRRLLTVAKETKESVALNRRHLIEPTRSWFTGLERMRITYVYHDAFKAGKHIDLHFSNGVSMIIRVSGKDVEKDIKYNSKGMLTEKSKKALMKHIKSEFEGKARIPHNWDHNTECAQMEWTKDKGPVQGDYGSGVVRQIILEDEAQIMKVNGQTTEMYVPSIHPDKCLYAFSLGAMANPGSTPILIVGTLERNIPAFLEKPKLTYIQDDITKFNKKTDASMNTKKMDGAASHGITDKKGTRVFSPRESTITGKLSEYTGKIPEVAGITNDVPIQWMAEYVTYKDGKPQDSAVIAGNLNRERLLPKGVTARLHIYRVDTWGKTNGQDLNFWENRSIQEQLASMMPNSVDVVELKSVAATKKDGDEGVVGIPKGGNLWNAFKYKWRDEPLDLEIKAVNFKYGPSSTPERLKVAGELLCEDSNGKEYKIGPGQYSNRDDCIEVMENPKKYIGRVGEFMGLRGHAGRSLKFKQWHQCKGIDPT